MAKTSLLSNERAALRAFASAHKTLRSLIRKRDRECVCYQGPYEGCEIAADNGDCPAHNFTLAARKVGYVHGA